MAIDLATGFNIGSKDAIDERQVLTLEQMKNLDESIYPDKYFAICKDDGKLYLYNVNNEVDNETGKFRLLEGNAIGDGTTDSTHTTVIFDKSIDMGKYLLLAKITNANYATNIIKFSCPNFKGQNQAGFRYEDDMDILKFELHFNTGSMREPNGYGVTLKQHGLGLYSYPLNNPQNTAPEIKEAVRLYWDYSKGEIYVFLVDLMTAIPHCVLEYTGSGTLLSENTFVTDNIYNWNAGSNGTWEESKWKSIPYNKLETPPIYELGGESGSAEGATTYTSLSELGLTAPVSVGEIFNAMPNKTMAVIACEGKEGNTEGSDVLVTDIPISFGVLIIKKNELGRFSIEYQNSLQGSPCNVKRWVGTLKGLDGTGLYWKQLSTEPTFVYLNEIGLTSDATFQDVVDALPKGGSAILGVKEFTNYQTIFPYEDGNDQFARVYIVKGAEDGSCVYARWFRKDGVKEAIAKFNKNDNKFNGWQRIDIDSTKKTLAFNSKTFKIDITKGNENWNGNMKFGFVVDESYGEIIISSLGATNVSWSCSEGVRYVKSVTYTIDPDNNAHVTIGVELYDIVYGIHQLETTGDFATINSFTGDAFTGTSVALRRGVRGRNHGVGILGDVADLGLTYPCTTVQIAQAMRNLTNGGGRIPTSGLMGVFDNGGNKITDAPSEYGLLQINVYGYDRVMIRYDGMAASSHTGSWIGQIKGNNGTFSGITWCRIDNETRVTTLETQVSELFQSVSDGKTLVANAITGKGVSTSTTATFATMATNIGKISGGYKEETKVLIVTSNTTGTEALTFTFSANVIAVKQIVAPSYEGYSNGTCYVVTSTSKNIFSISGKNLSLYVKGTGRWEVTALVQA